MYCFTFGFGVSKTNSASSNKENPLAISCVVNLFVSSVTSSSSCRSSSFLWASNSIGIDWCFLAVSATSSLLLHLLLDHPNGRKLRGTKEPLDEGEKADLKLNIQKTKIMASRPITSWQISGEKMETVTDLIFLGSKITVSGDCSQEIKRYLLLGRKAMINLDNILKSRDITLPTNVQSKLWFSQKSCTDVRNGP